MRKQNNIIGSVCAYFYGYFDKQIAVNAVKPNVPVSFNAAFGSNASFRRGCVDMLYAVKHCLPRYLVAI